MARTPADMPSFPPPAPLDFLDAHSACLARSLHHWTGRALLAAGPDGATAPVAGSSEFARALYEAPFVLVSHGTQPDPVLNYGNHAALNLWEMDWATLTSTPSRFTAEAPNRGERTRLLERVTRHGFIDDYSGIRISRSGRRFRIRQATVWNLLDDENRPAGQAARFDHWEFL